MRTHTHIIKSIINPIRFGFLHTMAAKCATSSQRKKLLASGLFDADFYVANYGNVSPLVARDPLGYYLTTGWHQEHNPSALFCAEDYAYRFQKDRDDTGITISPLEHYVFWGCRHECEPTSLAVIEQQIGHSIDAYTQYAAWCKTQARPYLLLTHELTTTGAPFALMNMAIALKKQGISPLIVSPKDGKLSKELERNGIPYIIDKLAGIHCFKKTHQPLQQFLNSFEAVVFNTILCVCWLDSQPATTVKKICWLHEGVTPNRRIQKNMAASLAKVDRIYAVNKYVPDKLARYMRRNTFTFHTLPYGLYDHAATPAQKTIAGDKLLIVFPGMICIRKGHLVMEKALRLLPHDVQQNCEIHIVGPHPDATFDPSYERLLKCQSPCLKVIGELPHDKFITYLNNADVIICPSLDDPLPIVCSEAFCNSKPVIVSDGTGTANLIQHGVDGYVIPANSPRKLAAIITHVTRHRDELPSIGARGRAIFDRHFNMSTFEANVADITHYIQQLKRPL